jgi:hypothetical protein
MRIAIGTREAANEPERAADAVLKSQERESDSNLPSAGTKHHRQSKKHDGSQKDSGDGQPATFQAKLGRLRHFDLTLLHS